LFRDAIGRLNQRAGQMARKGQRVWEPTPHEPALVIIVDEYAEMPEEAHDCADSIARRGPRAASSPSRVPSTISSRMNSASAAKTWQTSRPPG